MSRKTGAAFPVVSKIMNRKPKTILDKNYSKAVQYPIKQDEDYEKESKRMAVKAAKLKDIHDHRKVVIHGDHTEKRKEQ